MTPTPANSKFFNVKAIKGQAHVVLLTLDTLRYDVAQQQWQAGNLPYLSRFLPSTGWQACHSAGSFTYASHQAFFAGFLPTPALPGQHKRLFATEFTGSTTTSSTTWTFAAADIVSGLAQQGYRTICIGGVGFFNQQTPLSCVLPNLFHEAYWQPQFGVTEYDSTCYQVEKALERMNNLDNLGFLFMNISALHQPNCHYLPGSTEDTVASHAAALRYIDQAIEPLLSMLATQQRPSLVIMCGDHGTAYGEDGFHGHRCGHEVVWTVPWGACYLDSGQRTFISAGGLICT